MYSTLVIVIVLGFLQSSCAAPKTPIKLRSTPNYMKVMEEFKKLQLKKSKDEMISIATLGLISGAIQVEKSMEENLSKMIAELLDNIDMDNSAKTMPKIDKIKRIIDRDRDAIQILGSALDLARKEMTIDEYRIRIKRMSREYNAKRKQIVEKDLEETVRDRLEKLKTTIVSHMSNMREVIRGKSKAAIDFLKEKHRITKNEKITETLKDTTELVPVTEFMTVPIFTEPIELNLIEDVRRQDVQVDILSREEVDENSGPSSAPPPPLPPPSTDIEIGVPSSSEEDPPGPPGGSPLIGLIASLSGGEGGSDVGALVGALTGLVMNLFGPGGLDIPTLLSGGTALLAGLLSGDRNFGTVLGEYVGLAVDGFSGGGGAINNGKFFGNFLGTLIAELSADPEDDDEPPKPRIFIENFLNSLVRAKSKSGDEDPAGGPGGGGGSDSFGFIMHIVRAVVGGITSFILNASLGSSGGSSKGSASLSGGSSGGPVPPHAPW